MAPYIVPAVGRDKRSPGFERAISVLVARNPRENRLVATGDGDFLIGLLGPRAALYSPAGSGRVAPSPRKGPMRYALTMALALALGGCGDDSTLPEGSRGDDTVRRACAESGPMAQAVDVNNDGTADIRHVFEGQRRVCSEYDMNFDGRVDVSRFYESDGQTPEHELHDFDFDGRLDQISFFQAGQVVRKELDTNFDNVIDSWLWCASGLVTRAERARRNNGEPDTWEEYENGYLVQARYDDDNDGSPEKWEVFTAGRLSEIRYDTTGDGEPDRAEEIPNSDAGPPDEPVSCDGRDLEPPQPPAASGSESGATESGSSESGETEAEAEDGGADTDAASENPFGEGTGTDPLPEQSPADGGDPSASADEEETE